MRTLASTISNQAYRFWGSLSYQADAKPDQHAHLIAPPTPGPHPLVLCMHGGGWTEGVHHGYVRVAIPLVQQGFAAASVGYRKVHEHPWPAPLDDLTHAFDFFCEHAEEFDLNPGRIAAVGDSAGGHLSLMLSTVRPLQAVVSVSGPTDVRPPVKTSYPKAYHDLCTHPVRSREDIALDASPLLRLQGDSCPVLQLVGSQDEVVPPQQSKDLQDRLTQMGVPNERRIFPGASHALMFEEEEAVHEEMHRFLKRRV